jgi:hypothetical protein
MIRYKLPLQRINILFGVFFIISSSLFSQVTVNSINELRGVNPGTNQTAQVRGYYEPGDGGGGLFRWDATSTAEDNYGTIIRSSVISNGRWKRDYSGFDHISVLWFGTKGDDKPSSTNHTRIVDAATYAANTTGKLYIPVGIYQINSRLIFDSSKRGLIVEGILKFKDVPASDLPSVQTTDNVGRDDIAWSPATTDPENYTFRIVDEEQSSVLKLADNLSTYHQVLRIEYSETDELIIRNLAFNGNRERVGENGSGNIRAWGNNYKFENIATYNSSKSGIDNYGGPNVIIKNILGYRNSWHSIANAGSGSMSVKGAEIHNSGFDEIHQKLGTAGGYYGVDANGTFFEMREFNIHHNWAGMKNHNEDVICILEDGSFDYNLYHGYTTLAVKEISIDHLAVRFNGGAGVRITTGKVRRIGHLISESNGIDGRYGNWGGVSIAGAEIDVLIIKNQGKDAQGSYGARIFGPSVVGHVEITDNKKPGLEIFSGEVEIKSGIIKNNYNIGVKLGTDVIARLYNVKLGDDQELPLQTFREIMDNGNATLYHSNLDFSQSIINPDERIRVNTLREVSNVTIIQPRKNNQYYKENDVQIEVLASAPSSTVQLIQYFANDKLIGQVSESPYILQWKDMDVGRYNIKAKAHFSDNTEVYSDSVVIYIKSRSKTQEIFLQQGWNTISTYIEPNILDIQELLKELEDNISMVTNIAGNVYWPSLDINEIDQWDYHEGYQLYMGNPDTLIISGFQVDAATNPIGLSAGWNLAGYLLDKPYPVEKALESIVHSVQIVTNTNGDIYWPETDINSIGDMIPGQGYKIFVNSDIDLIYPSLTIDNTNLYSGDNLLFTNKTKTEHKKHYVIDQIRTGITSVLLVEIEGAFFGNEVGIWTESGNLVGSGHVINGKAALTVWGRNVLLPDNDFGAKMQEPLRLTLWSAGMEKEYPLKIIALNTIDGQVRGQQNLLFEPDAIFIAKVEIEETIPQRYTLEQNFPNPFNPSTTIRYEIPRDVKVTIDVYNLLGQKIRTLVDEEHSAGVYQIVFTGEMLASGVYFYRLQAGNYTEIKKMVLLR